MKRGYKHNTNVSGTDSEFYASSLYMMAKNPNGTRRPDLISIPEIYTPRLSIELKSGKGMKGILCESQLHYAVTLNEDYSHLFGDDADKRLEELLPYLKNGSLHVEFPTGKIAFYYAYINRRDSLKAGDLEIPFSAIKLQWGDQFVVPQEFGFYTFAVAKHFRTAEPLEGIVSKLIENIAEDVREESSHYLERRASSQSWQNIHACDVLAIFHNDISLTKKPWGIKRVGKLSEIYPEISELRRIIIDGPNKTKIYVLAKPEHKDLWDNQVRSVIEMRRKVIESVFTEREHSIRLLDKIKFEPGTKIDMFDGEIEEETRSKYGYRFNASSEEINTMKRLLTWMDKGEIPFHKNYIKDEVPF